MYTHLKTIKNLSKQLQKIRRKKSYEEKTFSIFTELNPNFRRIVNSRAQMDQLLLAINSNETKPLDLNGLGYLRAIPIDEIASSNIDFSNSNVTLEFDRMSSMKYSIIDNLIEQSNHLEKLGNEFLIKRRQRGRL